MSIESTADWEGLRRVAEVARLTLDALAKQVRPGVTTGDLDTTAARKFTEHGARSAPALLYGFPGTVLISVNDEIVHGVPGARRIEAGDIVKLDVTVEKDGYVADTARSVVVQPASVAVHRLAACAVSAFQAAVAVARAGVRVNEIGRAVEREVRRRGFSVVEGLSGHGVGRTIHEEPSVPNRYDPAQSDVLTEGLVLTIEPLISAGSARIVQGSDGWTLRTSDGGGRPIMSTH
jgi:methionyl aminopeptidase